MKIKEALITARKKLATIKVPFEDAAAAAEAGILIEGCIRALETLERNGQNDDQIVD